VSPDVQEAIKALDTKIEKAKVRLEKLTKKRDTFLASNFLVECKRCHHSAPIGDVTLVSKLYYVEPVSCSGGAYWKLDEYAFKCPSCCVFNRLVNWAIGGDPFSKKTSSRYESVKHLFKDLHKIEEFPIDRSCVLFTRMSVANYD